MRHGLEKKRSPPGSTTNPAALRYMMLDRTPDWFQHLCHTHKDK